MNTLHVSNVPFLVFAVSAAIGFSSHAQERRTTDATMNPATRAVPEAQPEQTSQVFPAQFQATVYEVQGTPEQLRNLDEKALGERAETSDALFGNLAAFGKPRLLFRTEQPVDVFSTRSVVGCSEPVVTATRTTPRGAAINMISYVNLGMIVELLAKKAQKNENGSDLLVTTAFRLSTLTHQQDVTPGQRTALIRSLSLHREEPLQLNRPQVMVTISSTARPGVQRGTAEEPAAPVAYVICYKYGPPAHTSGTAGSSGGLHISGDSAKSITARFRAVVYEVEPASERPQVPEGIELTQLASPESLLNSLAAAGSSRIIYQVDRPVNILSDEIAVTTNKLIATGMRMAMDQKPVTSSTARKMGLAVRFSADAPQTNAKGGRFDLIMSLNVSGDRQTTTEVALGQKTSAFTTVSQDHKETLELGCPHVLVAIGSVSGDEQAKPFVYVVRYQFDAPE